MWAQLLTLERGRLETTVPAWLCNSGAGRATVDYGERIAAELARDPAAYGYVAANRYEVITQIWDTATSNVPSLAFGRPRIGHAAVRMIPDVYYIDSRGFSMVRADALLAPRWEDRRAEVAWRGSVTGREPAGVFADLPRIRLTELCRSIPHTDVRLFDVHMTMAAHYVMDGIDAYLDARDLRGDRWPLHRFGRYRYTIDIDGHANAWGLLEKLILGCCVLKVESPFEMWFYDRLQPWVHYVPVAADLSDLAERIDWCLAHDERCRWIGNNGAVLAASLDDGSQLRASCHAFLAAAAVSGG